MTVHDPLASLVVPVPPYRGRGVVLPQVRLASADGSPGMSEDELLQAGSALEGQDQAARAAETAAEQPKANPLENMALTLAIEQQQEAIRLEAGQAHSNIDAQPPLSDADIAAKQEAHVGITAVESGAVGDIAAVGAEAQPATPDAERAEMETNRQAQAAQRAAEQELRPDVVTPEQVAEARNEPPKEPEPGNPNRGGRFKLDMEELREMFTEKITAAQNLDELYAAIRAADGNIVNERGVRYSAADVIRNIEEVRRTGPSPRGFATSALGIREKALALLRQENPNFGGGSATGIPEVMQGLADALREEVLGRTPPRPPRSPAEALFRTPAEGAVPTPPETPPPAAPEAPRAEAAPLTPEQQQIQELRNQVAELTRRLNAPPRPAGAEAAPAAAQELGAAAAGGAEGPPQEPEFGPEQPETSGAAEMAVEAIDGVRELGSDQELGFWERKGMQAESALFDVGAWWAGAWAVRAKNSQKARERKIRSLERAAQRSAKTFVGSLLNPLKYGWRINYHRWREGIVRAASERHNDKRTRYETARNDVLSRVAAHMEVPLRTAENRAEQNRQLLEQADADVARLHGVLSAIAIRQRAAQGPELDVLLERHAAFVEQLREAETARNAAYQAYGEDNAKAGRIQRINNQILKKQNPGDRPQAGSVPREVLRPRAPVPLPRAPAA